MESDRLFGRVLGQYMPLALGGLFLYIMFMKKSHSIKTYYWRYAVRIVVPLIFSYLAGQIMSASDKITVQHLSSSEAVAYLGIATSCSHIMTIFLQCLNSAWSGEDRLGSLFLNRPLVGELIAALLGMIPNCASSVAITQLYLNGVLSAGAMISGLLAGSGVGLLVLFRVNDDQKENIRILALLYGIGVAGGIVVNWLGIIF